MQDILYVLCIWYSVPGVWGWLPLLRGWPERRASACCLRRWWPALPHSLLCAVFASPQNSLRLDRQAVYRRAKSGLLPGHHAERHAGTVPALQRPTAQPAVAAQTTLRQLRCTLSGARSVSPCRAACSPTPTHFSHLSCLLHPVRIGECDWAHTRTRAHGHGRAWFGSHARALVPSFVQDMRWSKLVGERVVVEDKGRPHALTGLGLPA